MATFTDQKPHEVTAEYLKARWGGGKPGERFRCMICGYKFKLGDTFRWVYANDLLGAGGNPIVCQNCDTGNEGVRSKWKEIYDEFNGDKFWWFRRYDE